MKIFYAYEIECKPIKNENRVEMTKDWCFYIDKKEIWIPKGYDYNGASIPRPFWSIIGSPFEPDLWAPACAHDYLYLTHITSRPVADDALYQLMRQNEINWLKSHTIWAVVRAFGYLSWCNDSSDLADYDKLVNNILSRKDSYKFMKYFKNSI